MNIKWRLVPVKTHWIFTYIHIIIPLLPPPHYQVPPDRYTQHSLHPDASTSDISLLVAHGRVGVVKVCVRRSGTWWWRLSFNFNWKIGKERCAEGSSIQSLALELTSKIGLREPSTPFLSVSLTPKYKSYKYKLLFLLNLNPISGLSFSWFWSTLAL